MPPFCVRVRDEEAASFPGTRAAASLHPVPVLERDIDPAAGNLIPDRMKTNEASYRTIGAPYGPLPAKFGPASSAHGIPLDGLVLRALLAIVGAAAAPNGDDRKRVRELLAAARQYAVLEPRGRRIGAFIELVGGADGEGIAIRRDGIFLWRRRVLPITIVAKVLPKQRAVVLKVDSRELDGTNAGSTFVAGTAPSDDEDPSSDGAWQERIARYVSIDANGDDQRSGKDDERPAGANEDDEKHLLFVPTARGYLLVERDGPPPAAFRELTVPGHEGMFRVVKVSSSPLPNDSRVCAYVEQTR